VSPHRWPSASIGGSFPFPPSVSIGVHRWFLSLPPHRCPSWFLLPSHRWFLASLPHRWFPSPRETFTAIRSRSGAGRTTMNHKRIGFVWGPSSRRCSPCRRRRRPVRRRAAGAGRSARGLAPRLNLRRQDVDLENGHVAYSISRVAVRATIEIRGMQRDLVYSQEIELDSVRAGSRIEVSWPVPPIRSP